MIPIAKCQKMRNAKNATSITGPTKESVKKSTHNAMDMIIAPDIALVVFQDGLWMSKLASATTDDSVMVIDIIFWGNDWMINAVLTAIFGFLLHWIPIE